MQRSNFTATQIAFRWPGRCESTRKTDSDSRGQSGWVSIAGRGRRTSTSAEEHLCNTANETTATCFLGGLAGSLHYLSGLEEQDAVVLVDKNEK